MSKRFDTTHPFRLVVQITKGDQKGQVLEGLARGLCVGWTTYDTAMSEAQRFLTLSSYIGGDFASYGVVCIVNEETGSIDWATSIPG